MIAIAFAFGVIVCYIAFALILYINKDDVFTSHKQSGSDKTGK